MAKNEQSTISRTLRAAIRIGEDFYTVEETITLPIDAGDEEIARAVDVGMRIYAAQRAAAEGQIRDLRAQVVSNPLPVQIREPDAPASDKQRAYMDYLLNELGWDTGRLHEFATERRFDILTLNKREASELIDQLKAQLEARSAEKEPAPPESPPSAPAAPAPARQAILPVGELATQRQVKALERLAEERGIEVADEMESRYGGRSFTELSIDEAGQLLTEWQQRRNGRPMRRAA
jgi:pyruvate/2-oxoglutarate dehydrogenase complex dihydrolipoamide acyltransferase (E2) component